MKIQNDCVEYSGCIRKDGYGWRTRNGKTMLAHRAALLDAGINIAGKVVRHTCDNRRCVNVQHLIVGTQQENLIDKSLRSPRGRTLKLTAEQVLRIRDLLARGCSSKKLATQYGVTYENVLMIRDRKTWSHL